MNRIQTVSRIFRYLFQVLFYLAPITTILCWYYSNNLFAGIGMPMTIDLPMHFEMKDLDAWTRFWGCVVSMIPATISMLCFRELKHLFMLYEQANIFTIKNVKCYKKLGILYFLSILIGFVYQALLSAVLTWHHLIAGKHQIVINFGTADLHTILIGSLLLVLAWIMSEGVALADEQAQTI